MIGFVDKENKDAGIVEVKFSKCIRKARKCVTRARKLGIISNDPDEALSLRMDLLAADGCNGNRLIDWDRLIEADDFNFSHDIIGISRHINRETGKLENCFLPRFTVRREA